MNIIHWKLKGRETKKKTKEKTKVQYLWIHYSFFFKAAVKHVHGKHFTPKVAIVLAVVSPCQMPKCGWHICAFGKKGHIAHLRQHDDKC